MDEILRRRFLRSTLPPWTALVLLTSTALWLPLCAQNDLFGRPGEAILLMLYLLALNAVLFGASTAAVWLVSRGPAAPAAGRILGTGLGVLLAVNTVLRFPILYGPLSSRNQPFLTPIGCAGLAVSLAAPWALGALCDRQAKLRRWTLLWCGAFSLVVMLLWATEAPPRIELGGSTVAGPGGPPAEGDRDVVLIGLDGLSWNVLLPLVERGELPHLENLLARGARGLLASEIPTLSPRIWTTIATGRPPAEHGIHGFSKFLLPGVGAPIGQGPVLSTPNWWNGLNRLLLLARNRGWIDDEPYFSHERRVPAIWDLADHGGLTTGMVGWLASWPVSVLHNGGFRVSDFGPRVGSRYPELELDPPPVDPHVPSSDDPFVRLVWRESEAAVYQSLALWKRFKPRLTAVYHRFPDPLQHHAWRGSRFLLRKGMPELELLPAAIPASYRLLDGWLGRWLENVGPERWLVVVSDHGFCFDGQQHHRAPPGVLLVTGPGVRPGGVVERATIYDILPTLAAVLELPVPPDLPGRVISEIFLPGAEPRLHRTGDDRWYRPRARLQGIRSREQEERELRRLRSLGYVN